MFANCIIYLLYYYLHIAINDYICIVLNNKQLLNEVE